MSARFIFLDDQIHKASRYYAKPEFIITAHTANEVELAFSQIETALADGKYIAGYASYELGLALDAKLLPLLKPSHTPLLCFGVFGNYSKTQRPKDSTQDPLPQLSPQWSEADYLTRFETLIEYIKAGDIYQANLTFPYSGHSETAPDLAHLYQTLRGRQPVRYGGIVNLDDTQILSMSPELFFNIKDRQAKTRPMKGTAPRGDTPTRDAQIAAAMQADEKSRAENLMIVDLLRNDLSRVSESGSVKVTDLFTLETFPTLHQMTSGISSTLKPEISVTEVFKSLFPCGSITGAPKIRAMEIIDELETRERGPYCGAIGYFDPDGSANFNVAIRTLICSPSHTSGYDLRYNVGSGVVIDSAGADEYAECRLKARIVTDSLAPEFKLIETLLWKPDTGYWLLEEHMIRLTRSSEILGFDLDLMKVQSQLDHAVSDQTHPQRVRLTLSKAGNIKITHSPMVEFTNPVRLAISKNPLHSDNAALAHKTTAREFYDGERKRIQAIAECDEVLFTNEHGQMCEGSFTSLFIKTNGQLYTPPTSCGLLPGVLRAHYLQTDVTKTHIFTAKDMIDADIIYVGNSVRGLCPGILIHPNPL